MIRINLLAAAAREVEEASSRRKELILAGIGLGAVLLSTLLMYIFQQSTVESLNANVGSMEGEIAKIRKQNQEIQTLERQKRDTEKKLQLVHLLTSPERRSASVHILDDLSSSTPEYLWLTEFSEIKGAAKINGKAVDNQTIAAFAHDLARSRYFQKVEIRETAQEDPSDPRTRLPGQLTPNVPIPVKRFLIEASINYLPGARKQLNSQEGQEEGKGGEEKPSAKTTRQGGG